MFNYAASPVYFPLFSIMAKSNTSSASVKSNVLPGAVIAKAQEIYLTPIV